MTIADLKARLDMEKDPSKVLWVQCANCMHLQELSLPDTLIEEPSTTQVEKVS